MRRTLLSLSFVAATGCSLFADLDGLAGSAPRDAAAPADAAYLDASGPGSDARASGDAGDATAAAFCPAAGSVALCADFEGPDLLAGWTKSVAEAPGTVERSTRRALQGVGAARMTRARIPASTFSNQGLSKVLTGWKRLRIELDLYMVQPSWLSDDVNTGVFAVAFRAPTGFQALAFSFGPTYGTLAWTPDSGAASSKNTPMIPSDRWVHFIIDTDPTVATASVTVNGTKVTVTGGSVTGNKTETEIFIGLLGYNSPAPAFEAYYDNVLVTEQP